MVVKKVHLFVVALILNVAFSSGCASLRRSCPDSQDYFRSAYEAYQRKDYDAAVILGKRALRNEPGSFDASFLLAKAYWEKEEDAKAVGYLKKASRFNPADPRPFVSLGTIYRERGDVKVAIGYLEKAIALDPANAAAASGLAQCYLALSDYNNVIDYGKRAVEADPYDAPGRYALGLAYAQTDAQMAALEQYNILTQVDQALAEKLLPKIKYKKFAPQP